MKKILLAAMAMLFAMNMTAQNTQTISQEIRNSFRNGKPVFSKEIQAMDKAMHEGKAGEVFGEMYLTDLASCSECSVDRISIVSLSNVTSSSAKAVVKVIENCPDEKSSYQYDMNLIKEDGKWVIDDYNQMKEHVLKTFREHGIRWNSGQSANTRVLTDLISFKDIINTNGEFGSLVRTHGFKKFEPEYNGATIYYIYYYKNCVVRNNNVVPYGQGTSICICEQGSMRGDDTTYSISVFNTTAYNQLINDFLQYARQTPNGYSFSWANGKTSQGALFEENSNKIGGQLTIFVPSEE